MASERVLLALELRRRAGLLPSGPWRFTASRTAACSAGKSTGSGRVGVTSPASASSRSRRSEVRGWLLRKAGTCAPCCCSSSCITRRKAASARGSSCARRSSAAPSRSASRSISREWERPVSEAAWSTSTLPVDFPALQAAVREAVKR